MKEKQIKEDLLNAFRECREGLFLNYRILIETKQLSPSIDFAAGNIEGLRQAINAIDATFLLCEINK
jgi:hypothetical protein